MPRHDDLPFSELPGRGCTPSDFFAAIVYHIFTTLRVAQPATVLLWTPPQPGTLPPTVDVILDFMRVRSVDNPLEVKPDKGELLLPEKVGLKAVGVRSTIRRVPVVSFGSPSFNVRGPIDIGTTGLYVVLDRCLDQWKNLGGPLDPATAEKHNINDGFFIPTVYHGLNTPVVDPTKHQLGPDDGLAGFEFASGTDRSIRMFTDGPTANVDASAAVQLGNPLGPLLAVARQTDKTAADTTMAVWLGQAQTILTAAAALLGLSPPTPPTDFGVIAEGSAKVQSE